MRTQVGFACVLAPLKMEILRDMKLVFALQKIGELPSEERVMQLPCRRVDE